ncbi:MAG TPA: DUF2298 domain-containing protein, partial [Roseiflexaceae bacterium]|nr:DUF2298 domain-containing protein [Roseiflexaceae bacterium]
AAGLWGLRRAGVRATAALIRARWRTLAGAEALFLAALLFGLWLRWNGAAGPAISGTEKPMDLALLQAALRDPTYPPADLWFAGEPVNYYYLGYVPFAALTLLAGVSVGAAFNLSVATLLALTALMVAGLVATLAALDRPMNDDRPLTTDDRPPASGGWGREGDEGRPEGERANQGGARPSSRGGGLRVGRSSFAVGHQAGIAAAALLGVALVLLAGNQVGALQLALGGSQARLLDGGQLAEALWQRLTGAPEISLSKPTPPAPDFGVVRGWVPAAGGAFDWWGPSRSVLDDLPAPGGVERRHAITEFPFFSFYLGDLHPYLLALPHGLLILALALAALARPTLPISFLSPRGWLELLLSGALLGGIYAVHPWEAPGWWLLFFGALALLYRRVADQRPTTNDQYPTAANRQ